MDRELYLFFDTETTGLPLDYNAPSTDLLNWPRLVQISWIVSDNNGFIITKDNHIIKPNGFTIPDDVAKLHGITTERALAIGEKVEDVLHRFWMEVQSASYIIGHNVSFDENVVEAEFYRMGENNVFLTKHSICTKLASTDYCKIPNPWNNREYKWPKLSELYSKLFGKDFVDAHNSEADVQATFECFWKLKELGVLSGLELGGGISPILNEHKSDNNMHYTTFAFNAADYYGYGEPTTDFYTRLSWQDWNLFVQGSDYQTLLFGNRNIVHLMNKGQGISGNYILKDKNTILLSFGAESLYLHCVYYNSDVIIFNFDQSNRHLLLSRKDIVFHTIEDIQNYLSKVKQNVNQKREDERKLKANEQEKCVNALIADICRTGVKASDSRVESLRKKYKELSIIVGADNAIKYKKYIDDAITENQKEKDKIAEELKKEREEKREKKEKFLKILSVRIVIALYVGLWAIALYCHLDNRWVQCCHLLGWSAFISFLCTIALYCLPMPKTYLKAKILFLVFCCIMIIAYFVYEEDWHKFRSCFTQDVLNPTRVDVYLQDNFVAQSGDRYLSETIFHLFDRAAKLNIRNQINDSYNLYELSQYLSNNKSGYYTEVAEGQLYRASDILSRQAETLGDWRYIINNAPQKYKTDAKKNYARLDSLVWDNEELAYLNAKSLHTIEAYDKYLSRRFGNNNHSLEIGLLQVELKKYEEMMKRTDK